MKLPNTGCKKQFLQKLNAKKQYWSYIFYELGLFYFPTTQKLLLLIENGVMLCNAFL